MQLSQSKSLGLFDNNDAGVWNVHANLNDRRRDQHFAVSVLEGLHSPFLVLRRQAPVDQANVVRPKGLCQKRVAVFSRCQVGNRAFFN